MLRNASHTRQGETLGRRRAFPPSRKILMAGGAQGNALAYTCTWTYMLAAHSLNPLSCGRDSFNSLCIKRPKTLIVTPSRADPPPRLTLTLGSGCPPGWPIIPCPSPTEELRHRESRNPSAVSTTAPTPSFWDRYAPSSQGWSRALSAASLAAEGDQLVPAGDFLCGFVGRRGVSERAHAHRPVTPARLANTSWWI